MRLSIRLVQDWLTNPWGYSIFAYRHDERTRTTMRVKEVIWEEVSDDEMTTMRNGVALVEVDQHADTEALQRLMDDMWQAGIRPKDVGTPGQLASTQRHLDDMRAIVSKTLDVPLAKPTT